MSIVADSIRMQDSLSGGTTNLLRMARNECRGALAFVALALDDSLFATATYPTMPDDDMCGMEGVDDLVRQAWSDPELGHAKTLVRSTELRIRESACPRRLVVAITPLCDGPAGKPWGMLGVVDPEGGAFEAPQIDLLEQITQRVASYLRARQEVREGVSGDIDHVDHVDHVTAEVPEDVNSPEVGAPNLHEEPRPDAEARPDALWWAVEPMTSEESPLDEPRDSQEEELDVLGHLLTEESPVKGLLSLGALLGRAGRLIGASALAGGGALAFVVVEVVCPAGVSGDFVQRASHAIREELRFDDPVARIGRSAFAAVVPLVPGSSDADLVEARVADALRSGVVGACEDATVCSAHVVAESGDSLDADELLRLAVRKLHGG